MQTDVFYRIIIYYRLPEAENKLKRERSLYFFIGFVAMQCERCRHKDATVHLTEIIKGVRSEVHLCEQCARDIGLNSKLNSCSLSIPDMMSYLDEGAVGNGEVCRSCGCSSADLDGSGRVGCPHCYEDLAGPISALYPEVMASYAGKHPSSVKADSPVRQEPPEQSASYLKKQLDEAVREERYEDAAKLRDLIRGRA